MNQDTYLVYITLHLSEENTKRIAVDGVPIDITSGQFLEKIAPIIFENEPKKNRHQDQKAIGWPDFDYCLRVGDKILDEADVVEASEVDVIHKPEEVTNMANIFIMLSLFIAIILPIIFYYVFFNYFLSFYVFLFGMFMYGLCVTAFPEKRDYNNLSIKVKPKKNTIFEAIVILIRSFHPLFRLEDVLLDQ